MSALATIAGVGMTKFGKQPDRAIEDIGREALLAAMKDAGVGREAIDEVLCGSSYGGPLIGQRILRDVESLMQRRQHGSITVELTLRRGYVHLRRDASRVRFLDQPQVLLVGCNDTLRHFNL